MRSRARGYRKSSDRSGAGELLDPSIHLPLLLLPHSFSLSLTHTYTHSSSLPLAFSLCCSPFLSFLSRRTAKERKMEGEPVKEMTSRTASEPRSRWNGRTWCGARSTFYHLGKQAITLSCAAATTTTVAAAQPPLPSLASDNGDRA